MISSEGHAADQILDLNAHKYYPGPKKPYIRALADKPKI